MDRRKVFLNVGKVALGAYMGLAMPGCDGFFQTDQIKDKTAEILEAETDLVKRYKAESGVDILAHPQRLEEPYWTANQDGTYTLFYKIEFADPASLETIIQEQVKEAEVSTSPLTNQMFIKLKDNSQASYLEEVLYQADRYPSQVLIKLNVRGQFGNLTQDFASELELAIAGQGAVHNTYSLDSVLPDSSTRRAARASMGTRFGTEINSAAVKLTAIIDVLQSHGYMTQLLQTNLLLANNSEGSLGDMEKLPIPANVVSGREVIQTYTLEDVKSNVKITPVIYGDFVNLSFEVTVGSSKKPEARVGFQVPTEDNVKIGSVYLGIGQTYVIAGKSHGMEIGVVRDTLLPWPQSQDAERRITRIFYEITPYRVIMYDYSTLKRPNFEVRTLAPKIEPAKK